MNREIFNRINIAAPDLMVVCFDKEEQIDRRGRLYDYYSREEKSFASEYELLKIMEDLMEKLNYPQASTAMRNYREKKAENVSFRAERPEKIVGYEELLEHRGEIATFIVYIQYRQNATWQGDIFWVEQNEIRNFRSALEMLKLMDSAREE